MIRSLTKTPPKTPKKFKKVSGLDLVPVLKHEKLTKTTKVLSSREKHN
jgi:hypothetical protein